MKKFIILNLVVFSLTALTWAQERCEAPVWNSGDSWRYRNDNKKESEYKVLGVEDFKNTKIYVVESRYGIYKKGYDIRTLELKVDISPDGKKIVPMTDWGWFYDFPLHIGKKWEKMTEGKTAVDTPRNYVFTYKVLSFENVTVPAGTFKAFKIEIKQSSIAHLGNTFVSYLWYSPEVKREVKSQPGPVSGNWRITAQGYELKSFKLGGKLPITPEIKSPRDKVEPTNSWDKGNLPDQVWVSYSTYHNDRNCTGITGGAGWTLTMMTRGEAISQGKVPCQWCVK